MAKFNDLTDEIEESGVISAIWILSSNDESSLLLYDSVKNRLGLPDGYDVKTFVKSHAELFRHKIPKSALTRWKDDMLAGKRRPSFLIEIEDTEKKQHYINSPTQDDGFRSQFRTKIDSQGQTYRLLTGDWNT